ncbi:VOC family protein [Saccharopolyspora sp. CA-218241]|uniref:VOC family protein n=1 Tax=Saccharopolyspora sp. CA-218241 TaxID=3240027 RepID=UPI003D96EC08
MEQNVHFITFAVADLDAARRCYVDALGWRALLDVPDEIIFLQVAPGVVLGLFRADKFNQDIADGADRATVSGVTLSHNVPGPAEVERTVEALRRAGAVVLKPPQAGEFGGIFHAHVQDPNGIVWEIAHNPGWRVEPDGTVVLG